MKRNPQDVFDALLRAAAVVHSYVNGDIQLHELRNNLGDYCVACFVDMYCDLVKEEQTQEVANLN